MTAFPNYLSHTIHINLQWPKKGTPRERVLYFHIVDAIKIVRYQL